jgi:hypothetical protein
MLIVNSVHLFQHSTNAEQWSLKLEQLTKDPAQINVQVFINASGQIKKILPYALVDRKVQYTVTSVLLLILNLLVIVNNILVNMNRFVKHSG